MYYHLRLSKSFHQIGNFLQSKRQALDAVVLSHLVKDSSLITESRLAVASASFSLGETKDILPLLEELQLFAERSEDKKLMRACHALQGTAYFTKGDVAEALRYKRAALDLSHELAVPSLIISDEISYGLSWLPIDADSCLVHLEIGKALAESRQDSFGMAAACAGFGYYYLLVENSQDWVGHTRRCIELCYEFRHLIFVAHGFGQLLAYEMAKGNYHGAIDYGKEALAILRQTGATPDLEGYLDSLLYHSYKAVQDYPAAFKHMESLLANQQILLREEKQSSLKEMETLHQLKENELIIRNQELTLQNNRKRQSLLIAINIILFTLALIPFVLKRTRDMFVKDLYRREARTDALLETLRAKHAPAHTHTLIEDVTVPEEGTSATDQADIEVITEDRKDLYDEMMYLIESKKLYLNPKLDLNLLVTLLGTNRLYLFQALSKHADSNFRNLINGYRTSEAKQLIRHHCNKAGNTDLPGELFLSAGFNSERTFYRVFKSNTGLTAKEYAREYLREKTEAKR